MQKSGERKSLVGVADATPKKVHKRRHFRGKNKRYFGESTKKRTVGQGRKR